MSKEFEAAGIENKEGHRSSKNGPTKENECRQEAGGLRASLLNSIKNDIEVCVSYFIGIEIAEIEQVHRIHQQSWHCHFKSHC